MDINNKRSFITGSSIAELENIESLYSNTKPIQEGLYNKRKSTLRKLKNRRDIQRDRLEEALKKFGQDLNHYDLRDNIENDFSVAHPEVLLQTYINPGDAAFKAYSNAHLNAFNRVINQSTGPVQREIRNITEKLKSINKEINTLVHLQRGYRINEKKSREARKEKKEEYENLELSHSRITIILGQMLSFRKLFQQIPNGLASEASIEGFKKNIDIICPEYVSKKLFLKVNIQEYIDDPKMVSEIKKEFESRPGLEDILKDIEDLPTQFIDAVSSKKDLVGVDTSVTGSSSNKVTKVSAKGTDSSEKTQKKDGILTKDIRALSNMVEESIKAIASLSGEKDETIGNVELLSLKNRTLSVLKSSVSDTVVTNVNRSEMLEANKIGMIEEEEKVSKLAFSLERLGSKFREGPQIVASIFEEFGKDVVNQAVMTRGFPKKWEKKGIEAFKDGKRETVRALYGGQVPFCDEVTIRENKENIFILKIDAKQLPDGTYIRKSTEDQEEYSKMYGPPDFDIYSV